MGMRPRFRRLLTAIGVAALGLTAALSTAMPATARGVVKPIPAVTGFVGNHVYTGAQPPTSAQCLAATGVACYNPEQIRDHYNLEPLYAHGWTGAGKTIVIVDSFGSPTIARDLQRFDAAFHLPNPALSIIQPEGPIPPFNVNGPDRVGWAAETTLDVEWSHAIAPGANILLVETPVDETEGVQGLPQMVAAENYVIDHHLGDVISQSFGATEETFPSADSIQDLRSAYFNAQRHNVTVLASTGDYGVTNPYLDLTCCYPRPTVNWPASDPLVTALGGTEIVPNANGSPKPLPFDRTWNDKFGKTSCCATGGGLSDVFSRPAYQNNVAGRVGLSRGIPDISMSASFSGAVLIYLSFIPHGAGFYQIAGTSEASPDFAGIVAIADQLAGHDLGLLNPRLYALGGAGGSNGIVDVTKGNNTFAFNNAHNHNKLTTVTGEYAGKGYDLATGWGTINAAIFIPALVSVSP